MALHASQLLLKLLKEVINYPNSMCTNLHLDAANLIDATITHNYKPCNKYAYKLQIRKSSIALRDNCSIEFLLMPNICM